MTKRRKFEIRLIPQDNEWQTDIVRKVTRNKTTITKSQGGFSSKTEAFGWGQQQLSELKSKLAERNKARSEKRKLATEKQQDKASRKEQQNDQ